MVHFLGEGKQATGAYRKSRGDAKLYELRNSVVNTTSEHFHNSEKFKTLHPSILYYFMCKPHHPSVIIPDWRALSKKLCKPWQKRDRSYKLRVQNGLIGSARVHVTLVTHFALLHDFDSSCQHPSSRRVCSLFTLKKIGMASKRFTLSPCKTAWTKITPLQHYKNVLSDFALPS